MPLVAGFRLETVPQVIKDEMAQSPRGVVTVVDFVDFECPFCRMTHGELAAAAPGPGRTGCASCAARRR